MAVITPWAINADPSDEPAIAAAHARHLLGAFLAAGSSPLAPRAGALHPDALEVTLDGSSIRVEAGVYVVETPADGPYVTGLDAPDEENTLDPADATDPRIDAVWLRVYDHDLDGSGQREAVVEYVAGDPGPSPEPPAVPSSAELLADIDVPALGGGDPVVTDRRRFTWANTGPAPQIVKYTADDLWQKPAGLKYVRVKGQAPGASGGGAGITSSGQSSLGSGGGAGVYAEKLIPADELGPTETVTVGAPGAGVPGAAGQDGGNVEFGAHLWAEGGKAGAIINPGTGGTAQGGLGGTQGAGDLVVPGGDGGNVRNLDGFGFATGDGGASFHGGGGRASTANNNPESGKAPGSGGGGAFNFGSGGSANDPGGGGAGGHIIVEMHFV